MYYHHHRYLFMHCRADWLGNYEYERGIPLLSKVDPALSRDTRIVYGHTAASCADMAIAFACSQAGRPGGKSIMSR